MGSDGKPRMLFVRTYKGLLGGHLKVFDYLSHVAASGLFEPVLYLTAVSTESPRAFLPEGVRILDRPCEAGAYFVAGYNWQLFDEAGVDMRGKPVINLVQGLRHALPNDPRRAFLSRHALRICVSGAVERALRETGAVNGPMVAIPNGIDVAEIARRGAPLKERRVFIAGMKNPPLAQVLERELRERGIDTELSCTLLAREEFHARMGRCGVAVCLPDTLEGFFLPALEAMALGCATVLPQCEGAQSFALDGRTCIMTEYTPQTLADAVARIWVNEALANALRDAGKQAAAEHSLDRERRCFLSALNAYLEGKTYAA